MTEVSTDVRTDVEPSIRRLIAVYCVTTTRVPIVTRL